MLLAVVAFFLSASHYRHIRNVNKESWAIVGQRLRRSNDTWLKATGPGLITDHARQRQAITLLVLPEKGILQLTASLRHHSAAVRRSPPLPAFGSSIGHQTTVGQISSWPLLLDKFWRNRWPHTNIKSPLWTSFMYFAYLIQSGSHKLQGRVKLYERIIFCVVHSIVIFFVNQRIWTASNSASLCHFVGTET